MCAYREGVGYVLKKRGIVKGVGEDFTEKRLPPFAFVTPYLSVPRHGGRQKRGRNLW